MKVVPAFFPTDFDQPPANEVVLPQGLIGFSNYTRAELVYVPDHLPFLWMNLRSATDELHFIVIEPGGIVPDYEPEIFDRDAEQLDISDPNEAMILNIVTLRSRYPLTATANLIGPVVVNRRTRLGRQLVIANYSRYSAHHALMDQAAPVARTA